jgi:hypothetical protein
MTDTLFIIFAGILFIVIGTIGIVVMNIILTALQKILVHTIFLIKEAIYYGNSRIDNLMYKLLKRIKK